jgi:enoyl-CoA hydratase/carnithine racemase
MGWINRAFDTSAEMHAHIDDLVSRLVLFPLGSLGAAKQSINRATRPPLEDLLMDAESFLERLANPAVQTTIARALTATNNQSDSYGEQFLGEAIPTFYN